MEAKHISEVLNEYWQEKSKEDDQKQELIKEILKELENV